jgi:hypothetical protein
MTAMIEVAKSRRAALSHRESRRAMPRQPLILKTAVETPKRAGTQDFTRFEPLSTFTAEQLGGGLETKQNQGLQKRGVLNCRF